MFLNVLFWNIGKLTDPALLAQICARESIDLLLTAEDSGTATLACINSSGIQYSELFSPTERGIRFYTNSPGDFRSIIDDAYSSAKAMSHVRLGEVLFILVHYPSKLHMNEKDQSAFATSQAALIDKIELRANTRNTVVIGDFNFNPHEDAMLSAAGLNAVCCPRIAKKNCRTVKNTDYSFFYNPMWRFYAMESGMARGTFYSSPYSYQSIYWNVFDQVIMRPPLIDEITDIDIIENISLQSSPTIDLHSFADHLPIKFRLKK